MSQDDILDELDNTNEASSDANSEAGAEGIGDDDLDSPMTESSLPQEGDPDYEPDEVVAPKEVKVGDAEKAKAKVQLDIEDAPFLEDDEEEEEEEAAAGGDGGGVETADGEKGEVGEDGKPKKKSKKKLIVLGILAFLLLTMLALIAILILGGGEDDAQLKGKGYEVQRDADGNVIVDPNLEPFIVVVEPFVEPTGPPVYSVELEPFWVEVRDPEGFTFFIVSDFSLVVEEEKNLSNINNQLASIRDAIYYHLSTQEYEVLTNPANLDTLRKSLTERVNELLSGIKLKDLLYTSYTVR